MSQHTLSWLTSHCFSSFSCWLLKTKGFLLISYCLWKMAPAAASFFISPWACLGMFLWEWGWILFKTLLVVVSQEQRQTHREIIQGTCYDPDIMDFWLWVIVPSSTWQQQSATLIDKTDIHTPVSQPDPCTAAKGCLCSLPRATETEGSQAGQASLSSVR